MTRPTGSSHTTPSTPASLLADALRADPSRPLLTFHDATGERTELSVATFANWVAKTANLLRDELDVRPGGRVVLHLPLHWQAAVWLASAWAVGLVVDLDGGPGADLAVVTHDSPGHPAAEVVSLGLGPMGLPRPGLAPAAAGMLDYDREVHGHADRYDGPAPAPGGPALVVGGTTLAAGELAATAAAAPRPDGALLVTEPLTTLRAVLATPLVPLATGVTTVLCRHLDPGRLATIVVQEKIVAAVGGPTGQLPEWQPGWPGMT